MFISTDDYENFLVCRDYCVGAHDPAFGFSKNLKLHLLLIAAKVLNELLVKLECVHLTYQHVDCFYTQFKLRFSGNVLKKNGVLLDSLERAVLFKKLIKGVDKMPLHCKKAITQEEV